MVRERREDLGVPAAPPAEEKVRPVTEGLGVPAVAPTEEKVRPVTEGLGVPAAPLAEEKVRPVTEGLGVPAVAPTVTPTPVAPLPVPSIPVVMGEVALDYTVAVDPVYAAQNPSSTIKIGDFFYRPSIPTAEFQKAQAVGKSTEQIYADALRLIQATTITERLDIIDEIGGAYPATLLPELERQVKEYNDLAENISQYDTILEALNAGITEKELKLIGITDAQIEAGRYPDLLTAIEAGLSDQILLDAGYAATDIKSAKAYNKALITLASYKKGEGYDLMAAIQAGVSDETMTAAGFSKEDIKQAKDFVASAANLGKYTNPDGSIEILEALDAGLEADLLAVGLSTDIVEDAKAQLTAMQDLSRYQITNSPVSGFPYPEGPATNIVAALLDGVPVATLLTAGFTLKDITKAKDQLPKGDPSWDWFKANYAADGLEDEVFPDYLDRYGLDAFVRSAYTDFSAFLFPPARALKPEVELKDISGAEWAWGGVNIALITAPLIGKFLSGIKITKVRIPLKASQVGDPSAGQVVWQGLSVVNRPVFGKSVGRWGFGSRHITLPEAKLILAQAGKGVKGFRPTTALETNIYANAGRLKAMGLTNTQVTKIMETYKSAKGFAGKKSPFTPKDATAEGIKSLSARGVQTVIRMAVKNKKKVKQVYGSSTMKVQLDPKLAKWRKPGDIDIMTEFTELELKNFAKALVKELKLTEGARNVRIAKKSPYLIETKVGGEWHHAVDLHSKFVKYAGEVVPEAAFGLKFEGPRITVNYPGIGKVDIMSLSETGIRKLETIVGLKGGVIGPAEHRIKDIADFYVILRTFKGEKIANAWAKAYGVNIDELLNLVAKSPIDVAGWIFNTTTAARASIGAVPKIILRPPSALISSIPASLRAAIEKPISPSLTSTKIISRSASPSISPSGKLSPSVSPVISRSPYASTYPASKGGGVASVSLISGKPSKIPSVLAKVSASPVPRSSVVPSRASSQLKLSLSPSLRPSLPPSLRPSLSPSLSPTPSPVPSLKPSPVPTPVPVPVSVFPSIVPTTKKVTKVAVPPSDVVKKKIKKPIAGGEIAWKQGQILQGKILKDVWYVIKYPYKKKTDYRVTLEKPKGAQEVKGIGSAYKTIQLLIGQGPDKLFIDLGIMDIIISKPLRKAGRKGSIRFRPDVKQKTKGDLILKGVKVS